MPDKYIRISNHLHKILKIKSAVFHMTLKGLAESYIWGGINHIKNTKKDVKKHVKETH